MGVCAMDKGKKLMGRNAYARHRGCSPNAVRKAEASGRIKPAVLRDVHGELVGIDYKLADLLWEANTDPVQRDRTARQAPRQAPAVHTSAQHGAGAPTAAQLARSIALARVAMLEAFAAWDFSYPAAEAVELIDLFVRDLTEQLEAAGLPGTAALDELDALASESAWPEAIDEILARARAEIPSPQQEIQP